MIFIAKHDANIALNRFLFRLNEKFKGSIIYVNGYTNSDGFVNLKCNNCEYEFEISAQVVRRNNNTVCIKCNPIRKRKNKKKIIKKEDIKTISITSSLREIKMSNCKYCSKPFLSRRSNIKYCSDKCKRSFNNKQKENRKRKIKDNGNYNSDITLPKIIEKYNNICYICNSGCNSEDYQIDDKGNFIVGNKYPSIEHIIPVSKGGTHSWDNVNLAHIICNSIKSNK